MSPKKPSILSFGPAIIGLLLAIGVTTVFAACGPKDDGTWMHCHDVQIAILACGAIATAAFAAAAFLKDGVRTALFVIGTIICIVVLILPSIMPMCGMDTMRCHAVMAPFARIMGALGGVLGIVNAVLAHRENTKDLPRYGRL